jgi:hypothetical protein
MVREVVASSVELSMKFEGFGLSAEYFTERYM